MSVRKIVSTAKNPRRKVRWEAMWYVGEHQVTKRFDTFKEATDYEARMRTGVADGSYVPPDRAKVTFGEYVPVFLEHSRAGASTMELYRAHLRNHIVPAFGSRRLADVKRGEVKRFVTGLSSSLAPATVQTIFKITAMVFRAAIEDELLASSPCTGVALPAVPPAPLRFFDVEEVRALLGALPEREGAAIVVALGTGLRQGEVFGLRKSRIRWLGQPSISVEEAVKVLVGQPPFLGSLKTPASRRVVPMPAMVRDALAAHLARYPTDDVVFTNRRGGLWRRGQFNEQVWKPTLRAAGLPESIGFHALRHTYASGLIAEGIHPRIVMARLGHASIVETMNTYGHLLDDAAEQTMDAVDRRFGSCFPTAI